MSDLRWEAADYAELQMDGEEGGGLRSVHSARKGSFLPDYTAVDCSSLRGAGGVGHRLLPSPSASSVPFTVKAPGFVCADPLIRALIPVEITLCSRG